MSLVILLHPVKVIIIVINNEVNFIISSYDKPAYQRMNGIIWIRLFTFLIFFLTIYCLIVTKELQFFFCDYLQ